ncbi:sulfotransferase 0 [Photinus pyralis]|uniref:Sulfotransferase 0 n=1 Tax=Photinus pyralis TaxID=7054 RepID=A0A1Y1MWD9_PHOPY|nr:sulfotransferase 0 [Photinus pyralis]
MDLAFKPVDNAILTEYFTNIFRHGYIQVKGITLPKRFLDFHDVIKNFTVYDDDLWICSFPKSGTTWTQEMIWMIANDLNFEEGKKCMGDRFPFLDYEFLFDYTRVRDKIEAFDPPVYFEHSVNFIQNLRRPRLIKTHLPWFLLPEQIQSGEKRPKIIHIARNPRDVCLSYFHHCKLFEGYTSHLDHFTQLFLTGNVSYAPYWTNVLSYWEKKSELNFLFLKFEELKSDLAGAIRRVATFLCKQLTDNEVSRLAAHLSFENMKTNKGTNYASLIDLHRRHNLVCEEGTFIRTGETGSYKLRYPQELSTQFDEWVKSGDVDHKMGY